MKQFIFITLLFVAFGCAKDGKEGPQGPQGEQGEKGEQGIPGANGSMILSGNKAPLVTEGKNSDLFLNLLTGDLYGPKSNDNWGLPFNLKGEKGQQGDPGATILSGQSAPTLSLGKVGDFFININEMTIYGPKSSTSWGDPVSLRSDSENSVNVYVFKPNWNKNLLTVNDNGKWTFTTFSDEYIIPGDVNSTYNVSYAAASPGYDGLDANISLNQWKELTGAYTDKYFVFETVPIGLEPFFMNVKVESKVISSNSLNSKYRFDVSGKSERDATNVFGSNNIWIMLKSYKFNEVVAKTKGGNVDRYLRMK